MFWFLGSVFDIFYERFGDLPWLWFDHHTVTRSCMHADLLRLRGEGTGVPGAPLSLWQGEALSFVISSPVPSVRVASVVSEYVREIGRCLFVWWDYLSSPPFPQCFYQFETLDSNFPFSIFCMHTILARKFGESIITVLFSKMLFSSTHANVFIECFFPGPFGFMCPDGRLVEVGATLRTRQFSTILSFRSHRYLVTFLWKVLVLC